MRAPRASARYETLEQLRRPREVAGELLGVALDCHDEAIVGLEPLDRAVVTSRRLPQPRCHRSNCLVVKAVDPDRLPFGRAAKLRGWVDHNRVGKMPPTVGANLVALEVLDEGTAHRHVDDLLAAAEAKHRNLPLSSFVEKPDLRLIQLRVYVADFGVGLLAVAGRIDIPPTRKQQPVEIRH